MTDFNPPAGLDFWQDPRQYLTDHTGVRNGLDWAFIAARFCANASPDELTAQVRRMTVAPPKKEPVHNKLPDETVDLIVNYYIVNNKIPWIAKEMRLTEATVRRHLVERGVYNVTRDRSRKS